ncbi:MAG: pilus assembly protein TadG-related protein [Terracidiphilus sp.]
MRMLRDERGSVLALTALSMTMLLSFMALAIDLGNIYYNQRQLQTLADAAAMAGALEVDTCAGTAKCSQMTTAATKALTEGGNAGSAVTLTINNGPSALGASDPNNANLNYVEAIVSTPVKTYFAKMFGVYTLTITARAEAGKATPTYPTCDLSSGGAGTDITVNGGGKIQDAPGSNCNVTSDSNSPGTCSGGTPSVTVNGSVTTSSLNTVGNLCDTNGGAVVPSDTNPFVPNVPDPFASLVPPTPPAATTTPSYGGFSAPNNSTTNFYPGTYTGNVSLNGGNYTVNFEPGLYYFDASVTFSNAAVTSTSGGVTFFFAPGANLTVNSGVSFNLTAPDLTSQADGSKVTTITPNPYNGILIWQPTGPFILDATSNITLNGAVYVPNGQLTVNGGSIVNAYGGIISQTLMVDSTLTLSCSAMPNSTCPAGGGGGVGGGSTAIALAE